MVRSRGAPGCHGARMTGAGFGGCAVALVARDQVAAFTGRVAHAYEQRMGLAPRVYVTEATAGADVVAYDFQGTADGRREPQGTAAMRSLAVPCGCLRLCAVPFLVERSDHNADLDTTSTH